MFSRLLLASALALACSFAAAADDPRLKIVASRALPAIESATVYKTGDVKPGKKAKPIVTISSFTDAAAIPGTGPFDVHVKPKGGLPIPVAVKLTVKAGQTHELKLGDLLGTIAVFQNDDSPRTERIVVTATDDPGPDEKGHVAIQVGSEYREEMAVPEGFYAVWVVPANGARAQRVADRIRVLAGRNVRVGD